MIRANSIDDLPRPEPTVVTVGAFDGVHAGHAAILRRVLERAGVLRARSAVLTFDPHPRAVVRGKHTPLLTTIDERAKLLAGSGIDLLVVVSFDLQFAALPAEQFIEDILFERLGAREIVLGHDHSFGAGREGTRELLHETGTRLGFSVTSVDPVLEGGDVVSSSRIRELLLEGGVETAARLLRRRYAFAGTVIEGDQIGRTIGFPTANLELDHPDKLIPRGGVYAVIVGLEDGTRRGGMMNIGIRPTFNGRVRRIEVNLLNFEGNLYGQSLSVEFVKRIRDEQRFASPEALVRQLNEDRTSCIDTLGGLY